MNTAGPMTIEDVKLISERPGSGRKAASVDPSADQGVGSRHRTRAMLWRLAQKAATALESTPRSLCLATFLHISPVTNRFRNPALL
ncbi:MAG: hypothetical protein WBG92_02390 [Thiohalocapsa sp.]